MAHDHHRHRAPAKGFEPFTDALRVISRSIDHIVTANIAFFGFYDPFAILPVHADRGGKAQDCCAHIARTFGKRLGQLRGINIPVIGIIKRAVQIMGFDERIAPLDLVHAKDINIHPLIAPHALSALKFLRAFFGVCKADGSCHMVIHRVINRRAKTAIKLGRITLHIHHGPRG